jgi:hypothetical protein
LYNLKEGGENMAKIILKIKVKREPNGKGGTGYVYPDEYDAEAIKIVAMESVGAEDEVFARGKYNYEYMIGVVNDTDAHHFTISPDIEEIDRREAIKLGRQYQHQFANVTDTNRAIELLAKAARGDTLTQEEKDEIDPEKEGGAINKTPAFDKILDRELAI